MLNRKVCALWYHKRGKKRIKLPYKTNQPKLYKLLRDHKPCNTFTMLVMAFSTGHREDGNMPSFL